jgi:hypothetical protein
MRQHADQLLARSFEEDLSDAEGSWLKTHLASCAQCRELRRDLDVAEQRLEQQESTDELPARPEPGFAGGWRRNALVLAGAAAIVALGIGLATLREDIPVASDAPPTPSPVAALPQAVFAHYVVLDQVPGGGAVVTSAFDSIELIGPGGQRQSHSIGGVALGQPLFDGRSRVAYWRRASIERPSGTISGPWELVVMDVETGRERVLPMPSEEIANGGLLWAADRKSLVVHTMTAPGASGPIRARVLLIDVDSGSSRVLNTSEADAAVGVLYVDSRIVVGVRGSSYVVLDATSGAMRAQTPQRARGTLTTGSDGTVLELQTRFESESGPMWIWNVHDLGTDIAMVDERGISNPTFWPGQTEVVFTRPTGVAAVDYRTGLVRPLVSPRVGLLAVDLSGRFALVSTDAGLRIVERVGDELRARPDLAIIVGSTLSPLGIVIR